MVRYEHYQVRSLSFVVKRGLGSGEKSLKILNSFYFRSSSKENVPESTYANKGRKIAEVGTCKKKKTEQLFFGEKTLLKLLYATWSSLEEKKECMS